MTSSSLCSKTRLFGASGTALPSLVETLVGGMLVGGGGGGGALFCGDVGITGLEPGIGGTLLDLLAVKVEAKGIVGDLSFDSR